jgi:hypothetical protein
VIDELERLAREAADEAGGDWFAPDLIESDEPILPSRKARRYIAAASPDVVANLIAAVRAAEEWTSAADSPIVDIERATKATTGPARSSRRLGETAVKQALNTLSILLLGWPSLIAGYCVAAIRSGFATGVFLYERAETANLAALKEQPK